MTQTTSTLRKRIQVGLAGLLLLGVGGVASTAAFTDSAEVTGTATAGTLSGDFNGQSTVSLPNISNKIFAPGQSATDTIDLENAGNIPALVDITSSAVARTGTTPAEATSLASTLDVTWKVEGMAEVKTKLSAFKVDDIPTPAGFDKPVTITVSMPANAANTLQGKGVSVTLSASSTQNIS